MADFAFSTAQPWLSNARVNLVLVDLVAKRVRIRQLLMLEISNIVVNRSTVSWKHLVQTIDHISRFITKRPLTLPDVIDIRI